VKLITKKINNKYIVLRPFEERFITKEFVRCLNKKSINKYLHVRHTKQTISSAKKYFKTLKSKKSIYYAICSKKKNKLIGTITLRDYKKSSAYIGNMICYKFFFGTFESKTSFSLFLSLIFNNTKINKIYAGTEKNNIPSNFNLIANNFKLIKKEKDHFIFLLKRENFKNY